MGKRSDEIKSALSEASIIILGCSEKATVLKACNDFAEQEGGFPGTEEQDIVPLYCGMSRILYEIIEQLNDALSLIGNVEGYIDSLCKSGKEVAA